MSQAIAWRRQQAAAPSATTATAIEARSKPRGIYREARTPPFRVVEVRSHEKPKRGGQHNGDRAANQMPSAAR
jgi:hypothetical protein